MRRLLVASVALALGCGPTPPATCSAPAPPAGAVETLVAGDNAFALALYATLSGADQRGNLFFSPYSISVAFAMLSTGARGETARELAQTMRFGVDDAALPRAVAAADCAAERDGALAGNRLRLANTLWGQRGFPFLGGFLATLRDDFGAPLEPLDFAGSPDAARKTINGAVATATDGAIPELLAAGTVRPSTRLVLTNAIYFKGSWSQPFDPRATAPAPFRLLDGTQASVPLMFQSGNVRLYQGADLALLALPYAGGALELDVLLPSRSAGLSSLEAELTPAALDSWLQQAVEMPHYDVYLPRFKLSASVDLAATLSSMGMATVFTSAADLSGIDGATDLAIDAAVHQAFVEVDEAGTTAAAATGISGGEQSIPPSFRADRPFVFFLRDARSGALLFAGRLTDPR